MDEEILTLLKYKQMSLQKGKSPTNEHIHLHKVLITHISLYKVKLALIKLIPFKIE